MPPLRVCGHFGNIYSMCGVALFATLGLVLVGGELWAPCGVYLGLGKLVARIVNNSDLVKRYSEIQD